MQSLEVKCDVFKVNYHEYVNKRGLINFIYIGYGYNSDYIKGIPNDLAKDFDFNLIYKT